VRAVATCRVEMEGPPRGSGEGETGLRAGVMDSGPGTAGEQAAVSPYGDTVTDGGGRRAGLA